jgi:ankyrin repeat protein
MVTAIITSSSLNLNMFYGKRGSSKNFITASAVDTPDKDGNNKLHRAVLKGDIDEVISILSDKNFEDADLNLQNKNKDTPLHLAVSHPNNLISVNLSDAIIKSGADLNIQNGKGETPLFTAIQLGRRAIVEMLIEQGAVPDSKDLYLATDYPEIHDLLTSSVRFFPGPLSKSIKQLISLKKVKHIRSVASIPQDKLQQEKDIIYSSPMSLLRNPTTKLSKLIMSGSEDACQFSIMLMYREDIIFEPDIIGRTPLHWAAISGNVWAVKYLFAFLWGRSPTLKQITKEDLMGNSPYFYAIFNLVYAMRNHLPEPQIMKRQEIVGILRELQGMDLYDNSTIFSVIDGNRYRFLENDDPYIKHHDIWGLTPLHWAAMSGNLREISSWIKSADIDDAQNKMGYTPLTMASIYGNRAMFIFLEKMHIAKKEFLRNEEAK